MKTLKNKVILIAGGTCGIGLKLSEMLLEYGASVIIVGRTKKEFPTGVTFIKEDLRYYSAWKRLVKKVLREFGKLDVLINSVGMILPGKFEQLSRSEIANYVRTNLLSCMYGTHQIIQHFLDRQGGQIINIGSQGGIVPIPYEAVYSATKFAMRGFSLSLARELKEYSNIKVSHLAVGPVATKMLELEAADDNSCISFVGRINSTESIAAEIIKLILNPQEEVIYPSRAKNLLLICNKNYKLFSKMIFFLKIVGSRNQKKFRTSILREV